ncbi:MAG TPA: hypothetical protein VHB98_09595 [Chloroflexota bacterium]|jgi:hypothetical protein|nr:hypothetical protein [Chloroflexota bacterium]
MRTTVYLDEELHARLRQVVPARGLNRFISEAVVEKLQALERQQIEQAMKEGYLATRDDRAELSEDWGVVDTEDWPE